MHSEDTSLLDFQVPMSTMNRDNNAGGGYAQTLLTQQVTDRDAKDLQNSSRFASQRILKQSNLPPLTDRNKSQLDMQRLASEGNIKQVQSSNSQNKIDINNQSEFPELSNDQSNMKSGRRIQLNLQQSNNLGVTPGFTSNQSSQNYLASPSNTVLLKEVEDNSNHLQDNLNQNASQRHSSDYFAKKSMQKLDSDIIQKQGTSNNIGNFHEDTPNYHSQSIKLSNPFLENLTFSKKSKSISQLLPQLFHHKPSGISKLSTINPEKNLQNNLTKMVRFVKLKKKIVEMKRFFVRSQYYKMFLSHFDSYFSKVIDDASSSMIDDMPRGFMILNFFKNLKLYQLAYRILSVIPIIEPSSKFKLIWDLVIGSVFMIYFFFIPIHVAINVSIHDLITPYVGYTLHLLMLIDITFSMNTGFFEKGVNTSDKMKIFLYYIQTYFWSDVIAQVPLLISELGNQDSQMEKVFVLCFFVKLRNFQKIFKKFEDSFHLTPRMSNFISLVKLILNILFFSHIFGCIWLFIEDTWQNQYIAAYYFSTVTMITVGFGDIAPTNNLERVVCVGTMLISCVIFAYTISQIGTIFSDLFSQDRQMKEFFYIINDYMDNKNINFSLQYKIREYLDYFWREQDQNKSDMEKKIIDSLSDQLREKLMIEANRLVFKKYGIFSANFHPSVMLKMIPIIQTLHTTPNQIIFSEGQSDNDMFIFFIEKGKVEICREQDSGSEEKVSKSVVTIGPGSTFGAWSFFTNQDRREMVRSLEFSKLLMVRRSEFLEIIETMPQEMEKFNNIRDTILFENNLELLEVKCSCCHSYNHEIQHCHYFHFQPDKYVIVQRYNRKYDSQERDKHYTRKRILSFEDLICGKEQTKIAEKWKKDNIELVDQYHEQFLLFNDLYVDNYNEYDGFYDDVQQFSTDQSDSVNEMESSNSEDNSYSSSGDEKQERRRHKRDSENIPSAIQEEPEQDLTQSYQVIKRNNHADHLKDELDLSIKLSNEVQVLDQSQNDYEEHILNEDGDEEDQQDGTHYRGQQQSQYVRDKKKQISNVFNRLHQSRLTELAEQDESTPSHNLQVSERDSALFSEKKKFDKVLNSLGKESPSHFDVMATSNMNYGSNKNSSNQSIQMKMHLDDNQIQERDSMQDFKLKRPGFKKLTIQTNKSETGSIRTLQKIPHQMQVLQTDQAKKMRKQDTLRAFDPEYESEQDMSPQLIFIAQNDSDKEESKKKKDTRKDIFFMDSLNHIDDFNISENELGDQQSKNYPSIEKVTIRESKRSQSKGKKSKTIIATTSKGNITKEEDHQQRKMKKQKSVRINDLNDNHHSSNRGGVTLRSQTLIPGSDSDGQAQLYHPSSKKRTSDCQTTINNSDQMKRRKSSKVKNFNELNQALDDHSKVKQESSSPLKRNKIEFLNTNSNNNNNNNNEVRRKRSSLSGISGLELQRNISTKTDQLSYEKNMTTSNQNSDKAKRKSQTKFGDYEINQPQQQNVFSPDIKRKKLDKKDLLRSQSFKSMAMFGMQSNIDKLNAKHQQIQQSQLVTSAIKTSQSQTSSLYNSNQLHGSNDLGQGKTVKGKYDKSHVTKIGQSLKDYEQLAAHDNKNNNEAAFNDFKRMDSTDSQKSNGSQGMGVYQGVKKKSGFSRDKSSKLLTQSSQGKPVKMSHLTTNDTQQGQPASPYSKNGNNLLIPGMRFQTKESNYIPPPSPIASPRPIQNPNVKNKVLNFITQAKLARQISKNNDSVSSHQRSKQGENSPKSALSQKQMLILTHMMNTNKVESPEEITHSSKKNNLEQSSQNNNLISQRKNSALSMSSGGHISQLRLNVNGLGRQSYNLKNQLAEIGTPILKNSGDMYKLNNQQQLLQQGRALPSSMKQSMAGMLQSQFFSNQYQQQSQLQQMQQMQQLQQMQQMQQQLKDRSPTSLDQQSQQLQQQQQNMMMSLYQNPNNQTTLNPSQLINHNTETGQNDNGQEDTIFNIMDFEELRFFQFYFPKGNVTRVVSKANAIISNKFMKFIKILKKQKLQKRKEEFGNKDTRRGSIIQRRQQIFKKKSNGNIDPFNSARSPTATLLNPRSGSDEKIGAAVNRSRVSSLALPAQNHLEESQFSNESDQTNNKLSQKGSPQSKDMNNIGFEQDKGHPLSSIPNDRKFSSPIPKSIFNRKNNNN